MYRNYNYDNINCKIGIYIRLSREDGDDLESESVTNQRNLLMDYIRANNLHIVDEYVDDGFSGCNFDRPSFKRLIEDIQLGRVNTVITKDLSRLGRDHIKTGYYIENYFPENGIRYIAINDDIDTFYETSGSDLMPFRLSMNDMYAKDISKKVRTHLMQMKKDGKFCGSKPSYGYMRDPNNKHKLIPDPNTAPVVKKIFDLYVSGYGSSEIADILTREEVPTPIMLKYKNKSLNDNTHPQIWRHVSVSNILKNRVYTGVLIQHTSQKLNYKVKKRKKIPKEEWIVFENAHEPLVSKEIFEIAQSIKDKSNNYDESRRCVSYLLSDFVYCKDCGSRMSISYDKKRDRVTMNCNNYRKFSKYDICSSHYMNYNKLCDTVFSAIKNMSIKYLENREEFMKIIMENYNNPVAEINKKISSLTLKQEKLRLKQDTLYDDKFNGVISNDTYIRLYNKIEEEIDSIGKNVKKYKNELRHLNTESFDVNEYVNIIEMYLKMENPTKEILNKLIDRIYITKDKKVEIHYRIKN